MTILVIILFTASGILLGKRSSHMGAKEYLIIFWITLLQILYFLIVFLTMQQPPIYW
ncbi:MAG TPA: hypothetical protein VK470_15545 [Bacteroidota bacterium]|nr:hypothetical protein [Bacteroidota bacterium]